MPTLVNNLRAIRGPVTAVPVTAGSGIEIAADTQNNQIVISANLEAGSGIEIVDDNGKAKIINSDNAQALPIVAGAGVKLSVVNNQVVVSADETVLWEGDADSNITLSESASHFEYVKVEFRTNDNIQFLDFIKPALSTQFTLMGKFFWITQNMTYLKISTFSFNEARTAINVTGGAELQFGGNYACDIGNRLSLLKVIGINRIANN